jgi:Putative auto-transporter adhesin, head GIN domain
MTIGTASRRVDVAGVTRLEVDSGFDRGLARSPAEVTVRRLAGVRVARGSTVTVATRVEGPALRLELSGSSRVAADLKVERAEGTVSGASQLTYRRTPSFTRRDTSGASAIRPA